MQLLQQQDVLVDEHKVNEKFYMQVLQQQDLLIEEQKVSEPNQLTLRPGQPNETKRHITRYPPRLRTHQTSTLTTSARNCNAATNTHRWHKIL
jgi:hypothetical protein